MNKYKYQDNEWESADSGKSAFGVVGRLVVFAIAAVIIWQLVGMFGTSRDVIPPPVTTTHTTTNTEVNIFSDNDIDILSGNSWRKCSVNGYNSSNSANCGDSPPDNGSIKICIGNGCK